MAVRPTSPSLRVGEDFEYLPAGTYTLYNRPNKPARCPRLITAMAVGSWTMLKNSGEADSPPGAVYQGYRHEADVSAITCTAGIMVVW